MSRNMSATPAQPAYVRAWLPPNVDSVTVRVTSDSPTCMIVSVQKPECPVHDLLANVRDVNAARCKLREKTSLQARAYQTMSTQAAIPILANKDHNHVYIVFVVLNDDHQCNSDATRSVVPPYPIDDSKRVKNFTVFLETKVSCKFTFDLSFQHASSPVDDYVKAMAITLSAFAFVYIVALIGACVVESSESRAHKFWADAVARQYEQYSTRIRDSQEGSAILNYNFLASTLIQTSRNRLRRRRANTQCSDRAPRTHVTAPLAALARGIVAQVKVQHRLQLSNSRCIDVLQMNPALLTAVVDMLRIVVFSHGQKCLLFRILRKDRIALVTTNIVCICGVSLLNHSSVVNFSLGIS